MSDPSELPLTPLTAPIQDEVSRRMRQQLAKIASYRAVEDKIAEAGDIIRRSTWGATPPVRSLELDWDYDSIVVHYTGHENLTTPMAIQKFDTDHQHWDDISYHYAISSQGQIYEGRELVFKGSHVRLQNTHKIGIVCMGDFDAGIYSYLRGHGYHGDPIMRVMISSLRRLSQILISNFPIRFFGGHKEFGDSYTCPGSELLPIVQKMRDELGLSMPTHQSY